METMKLAANIEDIKNAAETIRSNRDLGKVTFSMVSRPGGGITAETETGPLTQGGTADRSRVAKFSLSSDEPVSLLGTDTAVSPAEYALKALAGCYMVTLGSLAAARGVEIKNCSIELEFDIDLAGFLGVDGSVRKGAQEIRAFLDVESDTSNEELSQLIKELENTSPLRDTFANPVNVRTVLR